MEFFLNHCGMVSPLGVNLAAAATRLFGQCASPLVVSSACSPGRELMLGLVDAPLPDLAQLPLKQRSRNNQMALAALAQIRPAVEAAILRYGAERVGIVIGTSTSGIASTEQALLHRASPDAALPPEFDYAKQEMASPALMLAAQLGITGPAWVHSSACSSSAKAMASAARLLKMGLCDAVLTGGVDTLCRFTVAGFSALESVSSTICNPLSGNRCGINIGEGAALFLMSREPASVALCGWGEASDGHHMSAPDPAGLGARLAITQALARAGISAQQIDYINLHGTATLQNDAMEAKVVHDLFGPQVAVSSTKPFTGHALGAAAALEAAMCWLSMQDNNPDGQLPPHLWDGVPDPNLPALNIALPGHALGHPVCYALSNSFAFGGSNAALVLGRAV